MDKIFVPVNVSNTHWCMTVIYMQEKVGRGRPTRVLYRLLDHHLSVICARDRVGSRSRIVFELLRTGNECCAACLQCCEASGVTKDKTREAGRAGRSDSIHQQVSLWAQALSELSIMG